MNQTYLRNLEFLCRTRKIDLSSLANLIGIDFSDIRKPTPDDLVKIADYFSISLDLLLKGNLLRLDELKNKKIKLFVMDVDGVLTDGGMYYTESGDEFKRFNAKDGIAIKQIKQKGIATGIISHGINKNLIASRASLLDIALVEVSTVPKLDVLKAWCAQLGIELNQVAYIGDDLTDLDVIKSVGLAACPADAADKIKLHAHIVLTHKGGEGCVRELIDHYLL